MKDETKLWLNYAEENLKSAEILLKSHLYNPILQNTQQAIEKYLKAIYIEKGYGLKKTHNIYTLIVGLNEKGYEFSVLEEDIDLIDSIYLTSKYPFGSVLAEFEPDESICKKCIDIAKNIKKDISEYIK